MTRSPITTHVLDTALGRPATGLAVRLEHETADGYTLLAQGETDSDGRVGNLLSSTHSLETGVYRLSFEVAPYLEARGEAGFYPAIHVVFRVSDPSQHHHVPLLLSPYGYSTYRGS